jgi:hypothetical protein
MDFPYFMWFIWLFYFIARDDTQSENIQNNKVIKFIQPIRSVQSTVFSQNDVETSKQVSNF